MAIVTKTAQDGASVQAEQVTGTDRTITVSRNHEGQSGSRHVPVGYWIVYHTGGELEVLDPTTFAIRYK